MKKHISHLLVAFAVVCFFVGGHTALAVDYAGIGGRPAYPDKENARTESIFIHTIAAGETATDGIQLLNNSDVTKDLIVYAVDSTASSDGAFACAQQAETPKSVGSWISFGDAATEVELEPNTNLIIPFTIAVPENADVGESNGCIIVQEKKPEVQRQAGVNLSFRTGIRVAITVPGDIVRSLSVERFTRTEADNKNTLHIGIQNSGNVSIDTTIHSQVSGIFGETLFTQSGQFPVLRGQTGEWHFDLPQSFWGGWYHAQLEVTYDEHTEAGIGIDSGKGTTTLTASIGWFFLPPSQNGLIIEISTLVALLIIVVLIVVMIYKKRKIRSTWSTYTPAADMSITTIAEQQHISWKKLARINTIRAPYTVRSGQTIFVPHAVAETPKIVDTVPTEMPTEQMHEAKPKQAKKPQPKRKRTTKKA